jgi:hypothetical protein
MESMGCGPVVQCGRIEADLKSWEDIEKAFGAAEPIRMCQGWRDVPDEDLRPATVRTGWTAQSLLVFAVLEDADIFNPVTVFNEPAYERGDVFEIFLRPFGQDTYYEFHVSPRNQRFQLRIPSADSFKTPKTEPGIPKAWFLNDWQIGSRVHLEQDRQRWSVLAEVPAARVTEGRGLKAGDEWLFSFSRYDYTRGRATPVHSSTSPHTALNYHRQQEWGHLLFA